MTTYVSPYTGQTLYPSQTGYELIALSENITLQWPINGNTNNVVASIIDVLPVSANLEIAMPPAVEVSTGQANLFRNTGSYPFTVTDNSGNTLITIDMGKVYYLYLTDNSTINGTWSSLQIGAGTSAANAAELAGYGLNAVNTTLNTISPVTTVSSNYLIPNSAQSGAYVWTGGTGSFNLPLSSTVPNGWYVIIINNGTGTLNIVPQGSDTINGEVSAQQNPSESFVLISSGSGWFTYGYGQSPLFVFTELSLNVTGGTVNLTGAQAQNIIQKYQGALTSNCTIVIPPIVQIYVFTNNTTGAYTLTFTTQISGGTTIVLPQNQTLLVVCDGVNVYNANSATSSFIQSLTLGNGSAANPSLSFQGDAASGLYLAASGEVGVSITGQNAVTFTANGVLATVGIPSGSF